MKKDVCNVDNIEVNAFPWQCFLSNINANAMHNKVLLKKKKIEMPILTEMENMLMEHNIFTGAYHGGKLNGVDCHEFIKLADIFLEKYRLICYLLLILTGAATKI